MESVSFYAHAEFENEDDLDVLFYDEDRLWEDDEYIGPGSRRRHRRRLGVHREDEEDYYDRRPIFICESEAPIDWGGILTGVAAVGQAVAPAAAMYFSNREWASTIKRVNRDWANVQTAQFQSMTDAYAKGVEACNTRYNSALQYTIDYGAAPMSPAQMATFCNGQAYNAFAGYNGYYGNGVGGFGNPYLSSGYSPQFLSSMMGPYAGYNNYGMNGNNPYGMAPYGSPNWGTYPQDSWYPGYYTQGGISGMPGGNLVTPGGMPFFANGLPPRPNYGGAFGPQYAAGAGYYPYGGNGYGSYYYASGAGGSMYPGYGNGGGPFQCLGSSCLYGNAFQQNQYLYGGAGGNAQLFAPGNLGLQFR